MRQVLSRAYRASLRGSLTRRLSTTRAYATAPESVTEDYDVVIVGGGPAGLAFANALSSHAPIQQSIRIALIEAGDLNRVRQWSQPDGTFSNRVSSITNDSKGFLEDIGAWKHVEEQRTAPMEEMRVWDGITDSCITFDTNNIGYPQMSQMTENLNLQRALLRNLDLGNNLVNIIDNVKVANIQKDVERGGWPIVCTSDGRVLRTRLLVGADGPNSPVRAFAGIQSYGWSYPTRAIVATLFHAPRLEAFQPPNTIAYQRFLPTGPIAFLPLSPTASSLVWSTKPDLATKLTSMDPKILAHMINAAFRLPERSIRYLHELIREKDQWSADALQDEIFWREHSHSINANSAYSSIPQDDVGIPPADSELLPPLVASIQTGSIASFPLRMSHADSYIGEDERGERVVLLGDAAHTIHPLAGQGLNMGLMDCQELAETINSSILVGGDIGSRTSLQPYARSRYFENHKLLSVTDKLHKLYASTLPPVVWARSVGLDVVNELDSLKAALMASAGSSNRHSNASAPWVAAAKGVEVGADVLDAARLLGRTVGNIASSTAHKLLNNSK